MRFYEFETKTILARRGIPVPEGSRAANAGEAASAAQELGGAVIVKAQLLVGSKAGASRADESQAVDSPEQAATATEELLKIDDGGRGPRGVLVEKVHATTAEYSLSISYDGTAKQPLLLAADMAGNTARHHRHAAAIEQRQIVEIAAAIEHFRARRTKPCRNIE